MNENANSPLDRAVYEPILLKYIFDFVGSYAMDSSDEVF